MKKLYCAILTSAMLAISAATGVETFADETNIFNAVVSTNAITDEKDVFTPEGVVAALPTKNTDSDLYVQINGNGVLMKSDSSNDTRTIRTLPDKYALSVLGAEYGWVQVLDDDGNKGYVNAKFITFHRGTKPDNDQLLEDIKAKAIVDFSKKFIGTPYVWGGTNLTSGVDCSGFVYSVYKNFGITLNRSSRAMYSGNGTPVAKTNLKAGDLVFFNTSGSGVSHVGMYIGNNQYIHSGNSGVQISSLSSAYSLKTYVGAKRILI